MICVADKPLTVGDKVRIARDSQFPVWSMADLEKKSGVSANTMYEWESGRTKRPKPDDVEKVAEAFKIPLSWFYDAQPGPPPQVERIRDDRLVEGFTTSVAVRTWGSANAAMSGDEECFFEQLPIPDEILLGFLIGGIKQIDKHDLVRVRGLSMTPVIMPGDRVLFYNDGTHKRNTIVMVQDPDHHVMIKALRIKNDKFVLESLNQSGPEFTDLTGWQVFGHAVVIFGDDDGTGRNVRWPYGQPIKV